ncbi:MAG TPA: hypothetical protein PLD14_02550 [Candidatus Pacearchaeota archaeon]|mgnify:CR=1 FL=1|nr:hypothetical protein [Candidatus Pacearchaeota archaeon]HPR80081.1 hypothetical protein [Candidatus Pacearchaeota archaeon]
MISKIKEKEEAIKFRKNGFSYSEILKQIPISRSTLSLWLRSVGLAKAQFQRTTQKRIEGGLRGAAARRRNRIKITEEIKSKAIKEVKNIDIKNLWLIGIALYWAEGSKEKESGTNSGVKFSNSDHRMILLFIKWLKNSFLINSSDLIYELYIHETADIKKAQIYWSNILSISTEKIRTYLKKSKIKTIRKNTCSDYHGLIRVTVNKSTNLNRMITGWIEGICKKSL